MRAGEWIALAGVGVATLAIIATLLKDDIRRWLWPPTVEVRPAVATFNVPVGGDYVVHAFARLMVSVSGERGSARGVQLSLRRVIPPPRLGGIAKTDEGLMLRPLRWAFEHEAAVDLPGGSARYVDLLQVSQREPSHARLTTTDAPHEGLILLSSESPFDIEVQIAGDNIRPRRVQFRLVHRGEWDGSIGALDDQLTVETLKR